MSNFSLSLLLVCALPLAACEKYELDRKMEALCKKEGGVKVYETVSLPDSMFDQWGDPFPGWRARPKSLRLGTEYLYTVEIVNLKGGDPFKGEGRLEKQVERVVRVSDKKLLGESITFGRSGGDFLTIAHPSSAHCPVRKSDAEGLIKSLFIRR